MGTPCKIVTCHELYAVVDRGNGRSVCTSLAGAARRALHEIGVLRAGERRARVLARPLGPLGVCVSGMHAIRHDVRRHRDHGRVDRSMVGAIAWTRVRGIGRGRHLVRAGHDLPGRDCDVSGDISDGLGMGRRALETVPSSRRHDLTIRGAATASRGAARGKRPSDLVALVIERHVARDALDRARRGRCHLSLAPDIRSVLVHRRLASSRVALAGAFGATPVAVVHRPIASLARLRDGLGDAAETLVQRQVVTNGIL